MWFRNLRLYRLPASSCGSSSELEARLALRPLKRCGSFEMTSRGWVFPQQESSAFVHAVGKQWLVALGIEQKLLPATVVRQAARDEALRIEAEQNRKVGRKELRDITERVMEEYLPKAFSQRRTTWGWIDPQHGWLVVDAGSDARADEFLEVFLGSADTMNPRPLQTQVSGLTAMTDWLSGGEPPAGFTFDSDLELRAGSESQSAIRYVRHDIGGQEVTAHIAAGKLVTKLGMTWKDRISFVLTDKLHIKRLAFLDILKDESQQAVESGDAQLDADFALMTGELAQLFEDLLVALGGERKPA